MSFRLAVIAPSKPTRERLCHLITNDPRFLLISVGPNLYQASLQLASKSAPDAILVDLSHQAIAQPAFWITLNIMCPGVKLIALVETALDKATLSAALQAGLHCFVQWTDSIDVLHESVCRACEGRRYYSDAWLVRAVQQLVYEIETGVIQINSHLTDLHDEVMSCQLTILEQQVLSYLLQKAGRLVTSAELTMNVWNQDPNATKSSNQVNCCIKRLRHKLNSNHGNSIRIITIRKQGYRLTVERGP